MEFYADKEKHLEKKINKAPERLDELFAEWMQNHVSNKAIQTQTFYKSLWKNHIEDKNKGKIKLDIMLPKHIYDILDNVEGDRAKQAVYKMLKAMLNKGKKWKYVKYNPCDGVDAPKYDPEGKTGIDT
jgi:predicted GNAT superfamily acetyltransferase